MDTVPAASALPRRLFIATNLVGGVAVLASYVVGVGDPVFTAGMWGGVPEALRPYMGGQEVIEPR